MRIYFDICLFKPLEEVALPVQFVYRLCYSATHSKRNLIFDTSLIAKRLISTLIVSFIESFKIEFWFLEFNLIYNKIKISPTHYLPILIGMGSGLFWK